MPDGVRNEWNPYAKVIAFWGHIVTKLYAKLYSIYAVIRGRIFLCLLKMSSVSVGKGVFIHWDSRIKRGTIIGDYTRINGPILIKGRTRVDIGKYCAIGWNVAIISTNHPLAYANIQYNLQERSGFSSFVDDRGSVSIGDNVWIGDRAAILAGVHIGSGAVVGACSVVTKNVPPFSVVAGIPARTIRKRFNDAIIEKLMEIRWWDWPIERIRRNRKFFETDLTKVSVHELESMILP
jgi:virginiamycin A acetyltransferase